MDWLCFFFGGMVDVKNPKIDISFLILILLHRFVYSNLVHLAIVIIIKYVII